MYVFCFWDTGPCLSSCLSSLTGGTTKVWEEAWGDKVMKSGARWGGNEHKPIVQACNCAGVFGYRYSATLILGPVCDSWGACTLSQSSLPSPKPCESRSGEQPFPSCWEIPSEIPEDEMGHQPWVSNKEHRACLIFCQGVSLPWAFHITVDVSWALFYSVHVFRVGNRKLKEDFFGIWELPFFHIFLYTFLYARTHFFYLDVFNLLFSPVWSSHKS